MLIELLRACVPTTTNAAAVLGVNGKEESVAFEAILIPSQYDGIYLSAKVGRTTKPPASPDSRVCSTRQETTRTRPNKIKEQKLGDKHTTISKEKSAGRGTTQKARAQQHARKPPHLAMKTR